MRIQSVWHFIGFWYFVIGGIVAPKKGIKIADIACGQGLFSKALSEHGAQVYAADISPELIHIAKKYRSETNFEVASADRLPWSKGSMDTAVIVLALQNIADINAALAESSRILRIGGKLVLVLNHPAFRVPKKSSWGIDESKNIQFRRIDEYMSENKTAIEMHPGRASGIETYSFHRPLQTYFKVLHKAGFAVLRLEEWVSNRKSERGRRQGMEDRARREFPLFMMIECKKNDRI